MILVISRFGFEGWIWVLVASVPDLCILLLLTRKNQSLVIEPITNIPRSQ